MFGKRLSRQIKRSFGVETPEEISKLDPARLAEGLAEFLPVVEETYQQLDDKLSLSERNLRVSSEELTAANSNLFQVNQSFDAMVNSLGQGFLLFGPDLVCMPAASKICETLLECSPSGMAVNEVLRVPAGELSDFTNWCRMMFDERIAFEDLAALGPGHFSHSDSERMIQLDYKPCRDRSGKIAAVVMVATDRTLEFAARKQAEELAAHVKMITNILKNKNRFGQFVNEMRRMIREFKALGEIKTYGAAEYETANRLLHTMKGVSGAFGLLRVKGFCHETESRLLETAEIAGQILLIKKAAVELHAEFESLLESNREILGDIGRTEPKREFATSVLQNFMDTIASAKNKEEIAHAFRSQILATSLRRLLGEFDAFVEDMSSQMGKAVAPIRFIGEDPRVIESEIAPLLNVLPHLLSNIVEHGIEAQSERSKRGKPAAGLIEVRLGHSEGKLQISIRDDGAGIDVDGLRRKLAESGQEKLAESGTDEQIINQIFRPGVTTAKRLSQNSGRGVGMDAVKNEIAKMGGQIKVQSKPGVGTAFTIEIPVEGLAKNLAKAS